MTLLSNKFENKNIHRFTHNAMNTIFEIIIDSEEKEYAEQAANSAFEVIDRLEEVLSRFKPNSEISKINSLKIGEELKLNIDVFECLQIANNIYNITNGVFDITSGQIIDRWKNKNSNSTLDAQPINIGMNKIKLDATNYSINILSKDLTIDLGGIGKGFAIDKACDLLSEWDIENAIVHSGSTVKAIGNLTGYNGWPISISNPINTSQTIAEIILTDNSLSGSGKQKGAHIINPVTSLPVDNKAGTWAMANSAALSDAMSTTFMIIPTEEIYDLCNNHNSIAGLVIKNDIARLTNNDIFISNNFRLKLLV
jgi:thiamine biosynthesis lipoprotein